MDKTCRPQLLEKSVNQDFHKMLNSFATNIVSMGFYKHLLTFMESQL